VTKEVCIWREHAGPLLMTSCGTGAHVDLLKQLGPYADWCPYCGKPLEAELDCLCVHAIVQTPGMPTIHDPRCPLAAVAQQAAGAPTPEQYLDYPCDGPFRDKATGKAQLIITCPSEAEVFAWAAMRMKRRG